MILSSLEYAALHPFKYEDLPIFEDSLSWMHTLGYLKETGNHIVTKNAAGDTITAFTYGITTDGLLALEEYELDAQEREQKVKDIITAYTKGRNDQWREIMLIVLAVLFASVVDHWSDIVSFIPNLFK